MGRKKPKDDIERLEQQIRELKSVNRSLLKRLKKLDRNYKEMSDESERSVEDGHKEKAKEKERAKRPCTHCERGFITEVNIVGRIFFKCTVCDWRSGAKKKEP